ncbi:MAG: TetR/AcrR family transcriptional regulator C-terminal domain-containing protein [Eubacteriales bacterium]|nr:TetR/AcrR family transcriptional regulator C-terminal domain-containing protein [Eubacteriales bacterium]
MARAAKDCMAASGTDGLTVTQIVRACGVTRQTFYRNFADKYALINWYFDKLLLESFARMGDGLTIREGLERKFEFIHRERLFFANAFRSDGQNALREHDYELILQFYTDLIRKKTGRRPAEDLLFCLKLYCRGSIHMTVDWILSPDKRTPARMAALLTEAMPRKLAELFASLGLL